MKDKESENKDKIKYLQELINTGTPTERAIVYIRNTFDIEHGPLRLNEKEAHVLAVSFTTQEELREANRCVYIYNTMVQYSKGLEAARSKYKEEAARLTGLIARYESVLMLEVTYRSLLKKITFVVDLKSLPTETLADVYQKTEGAKSVLGYLFRNYEIRDLVKGKYSKELEKEMKEQSKKTADALAIFKTKLEVIKSHILGGGRLELWSQLIPNNLANMILTPDYIPEKEQENLKKYFKENLREREEKGETIGTQEKKLALYPYYANLRTIKKVKEEAKSELEQLINIWQNIK